MRKPRPRPRSRSRPEGPVRLPRGPTRSSAIVDPKKTEGLESLQEELESALAEGSRERVAQVRARIVERAPDSAEGAEAAFKLGLFHLFERREVDAAEAGFRSAIRARKAPWTHQARVSLAQVLMQTGRPQQAAFELRKVCSEREEDLVSVQARAFLVDALRATGKPREAERLREAQKEALFRLGEKGGVDGAVALVWLAFERKHDGDRRGARVAFEAALSEPSLPDETKEAAERGLETL